MKKIKMQRLTAFLLSFCLLVSVCSVAFIAGAANEKVWDGTTSGSYAGGDGSGSNPYIIETAEQFAYLISEDTATAGKSYKLGSDLYLNDVSSSDWYKNARNWYTRYTTKSGVNFAGSFDGAGYTIYGYRYENTSATAKECVSLFARAAAGISISNLTVSDVYININHQTSGAYESSAAAIISVPVAMTVTNTMVKNAEIKITNDTKSSAAGFATYGSNNVTLKSCAFVGSVDAHYAGAFFGDFWGGTLSLEGCYASGVKFSGRRSIVAENCYGTVSEAVSGIAVISADKMQGTTSKINMPLLDWENGFETTAGYPKIKGSTAVEGPSSIWSGNVAAAFEGGTGTEKDPYIIKNADQLAYLVTTCTVDNSKGKFYKLSSDIYLNDVSKPDWYSSATANEWYGYNASARFAGTFDGDGHTVFGLLNNKTATSFIGLFSHIEAYVAINNLIVSDVYINRPENTSASALVGFVRGGTESINFTNCIVKNAYIAAKNAGGLASYGSAAATNVTSCAFDGEISGKDTNGALIADIWGSTITIKNSYAVGNVLCGRRSFTGVNCYGTKTEKNGTVTVVNEADIKGANAKTAMPGLDWKLWQTVENGYPTIDFSALVAGESGYESGIGTIDDPYIIKTAEQLSHLANNDNNSSGKYYVLANDIYLNDVARSDWTKDATKWTSAVTFGGNLNGAGYTVYGLYINEKISTRGFYGLFAGASNTAVFSNLTLSDVEISVEDVSGSKNDIGAAAFAGSISLAKGTDNNKALTFSKCIVKNANISVVGTGNTSAAGFVTYGSISVSIDGCGFVGSVNNNRRYGAFIGDVWWSQGQSIKVSNSYSSGVVLSSAIAITTSNCYATDSKMPNSTEGSVTKVTADQMQGANAKANMPALDWSNTFETTSGYPKCKYSSSEGAVGEAWSGNTASKYAGGKGTIDEPYLIETAEQLAYLVSADSSTKGKFYKLTADIILNDTEGDWLASAPKPWFTSSSAKTFEGTLDGAGHTVSGLYYKAASNSTNFYVALIPKVKAATITNLGVINSYIELNTAAGHETYIAAIAGSASGVSLTGCYADETVTLINNAHNKAFIGGLIAGGSGETTLNTCYFTGKLQYHPDSRYGALIGNVWNGTKTITNCYAIDACLSSYNAANIGGANNYATVEDKIPSVTVVDKALIKGEGAKTTMPNLNWKLYVITESYPTLKAVNPNGTKGEVWSGMVAIDFAGGNGTEADPYLIETPEQLAKLVSKMSDTIGNESIDKYYKLTADIYLNDVKDPNWKDNANPWYYALGARQGNFRGHFDGDGHVVYGIYVNAVTETNTYAALFPAASDGATIKRVGVSDSYIKLNTDSENYEKYAAALVGYVFFNDNDNPKDLLTISECFGSSSVVIDAVFAGGIISGAPRPANVKDSYFVGTLLYTDRSGGIIGNTWTDHEGATIENCYSATKDGDPLMGGRSGSKNSSSPFKSINNYANSNGAPNMVTRLDLSLMRKSKAPDNMKGFDFENVWALLDNGTPVLRIFGTTDKFSNTTEPPKIEVSFISNGGTELEPMYGYPEDKLDLPTPTREGYEFGGWYVYRELDIEYPNDKFPYFDSALYAKWNPIGYAQDFEDYPNTEYDMHEDYEYYLPGAEGYDARYVRSGTKSIHRLGETVDDEDFLAFYENKLEKGREYEIVFYMTTDSDTANTDLSVAFKCSPDVYVADTNIKDLGNIELTKGEWTRVSVKTIAHDEYLSIRTSGGQSIFFDDLLVIPTGGSGKVEQLSNNTVNNDYESDRPIFTPSEPEATDTNTESNTGADTEPETPTEEPENNGGSTENKKPTKPSSDKKTDSKTDSGVAPWIIVVIALAAAAVIAGAVITVIVIKKKK